MTIWRHAAHTDAIALRLLPPGVRHQPTDLQAALDDHAYLERRQHANERVRQSRKKRDGMTLVNLNKTPFPWFGGKTQAADLVWKAFGDVPHYVEPFFGGGAPYSSTGPTHATGHTSPKPSTTSTDWSINAWRAMQQHPEATAEHASWPQPVTEADKTGPTDRRPPVARRSSHARPARRSTPRWCDPQMAGWWLWAVCVQIGAFDGRGPWTADPVTGRIYKQDRNPATRQPGVRRNLPHLSDDGRGVNRPGTRQPGVSRDRPFLSNNGQGVNHAGTREPGVSRLDALAADGYHDITMPELVRWFRHLSARLRHVRILNGDWTRTVTSGAAKHLPVRQGKGPAGIFLDPPYDTGERAATLYTHEADGDDIPAAVRAWCLTNGNDPDYRIALAGYDTEHQELEHHGWTVHEWFQAGHLTGGMGNTNTSGGAHQQGRERIWLSPHCLNPDGEHGEQLGLFT